MKNKILLFFIVMIFIFSGCTIKKQETSLNASGENTDEYITVEKTYEITENTNEKDKNSKNNNTTDKEEKKNESSNQNNIVIDETGKIPNPGSPYDDEVLPVNPEVKNSGFVKGVTDIKSTFSNKTLRFYVAETWGHPTNNRYILYPKLKKDYNLTIEAKPSTYLRDTLQNIQEIKARKQIDIIGTGHEKMPSVFAICQPLQNKIYVERAPAGIDKTLLMSMKKGNDIMYLPLSGYKDGIFYNVANIKSAGKELPYDLLKKGEWTWEKFEEYCKFFTEDNDKNGVPEKWGFGCWPAALHEFALTNNTGYYSYNADGSVTSNITTPAVIESINYVKRIHGKEKCFYFFKGMGNYPEFYNDETVTMLKIAYPHNPKNLELGMVTYPKGPNAGSENIVTSSGIGYGLPSTMVKKSNEKAALLFIETMLNYEAADMEREYKVRLAANKRWKEEYQTVFKDAPAKVMILYGVGEIPNSLIKLEEAIYDPSKSVENTVQSLKSVFEYEGKKVYTLGN